MSKQTNNDDWIYDRMFGAILEQRLTPGVKLNESVLCEIFGVSRTIIRRVLLRLSLDRVVELRPNKGAVIAKPQAEDVRQMFAARLLLENGIIADAAAKCTAKDDTRLRNIVAQENTRIQAGDRSGAIRLSGDFHLALATIAGNRPLEELLRQLVAQTSLAIALYESPGHLLCVEDDHINIAAAVQSGNARQSQKLMRAHLLQCEAQLSLIAEVDRHDLRAVFADVLREREFA